MFTMFPVVKDMQHRRGGDLSGGQQQQLAQRGEVAIRLVEQYYDFARALAVHYLVMSRGQIVKHGLGIARDADNIRNFVAL